MMARALVLSALAEQPSELRRPLRARDTALMADGLRALGVGVDDGDPERWLATPAPLRGPASIDVGLAGTVMRFLPPVAALATGEVRFDGDPYARKRPLAPLVRALDQLGVVVEAGTSGGLPLTIHGTGQVAGGTVVIDASTSSQFVSALLLAAPAFGSGLVLRNDGPPVPSAPHLRMTAAMLREAGAEVDDSVADLWSVAPGKLSGRGWDIEPDLSGAAPFLAAALVTGGEVGGRPGDPAPPAARRTVRDLRRPSDGPCGGGDRSCGAGGRARRRRLHVEDDAGVPAAVARIGWRARFRRTAMTGAAV
jgi:3-phosphoshikimate 1-carboxyvinyltransferase